MSEKTKHYLSDKTARRTSLLRGCVADARRNRPSHR
jgi:hypothetical protein